MEEKKLTASFIIEMLGKPPEHLKTTLEQFVEKLGKEDGVKIIESFVHEPRKYEHKEDEEQRKKTEELRKKLKNDDKIVISYELFTTFAEVEAEFDSMESLLNISFNYMPSNIEITNPQSFLLRNTDFSGLLTGIIMRLHRYDELAKKLTVDNTILENKLKEIIDSLNKKNKKN